MLQELILLIEDNPDHMELLKRSLEAVGFINILEASNLKEAKAVLVGKQVKLVICDLKLPDGEGTEILKEMTPEESLPCIFMTSHGNEERAVEVMKMGALDYVVKSFENIRGMGGFALRSLRERSLFLEKKAAEDAKLQLERKLFQAQKLEAMGTLAGSIAHDFNNILAGILGYADLALMELSPESRAAQKIGEIKKAGQRASEMIRQILNFSKPVDRKQEPLDLRALIGEAAGLVESTCRFNVKVRLNLADDVSPILAASTQIHQLLMNVMTIGVQAMPKGGVLEVSLTQENVPSESWGPGLPVAGGTYARLQVEDTGVGMGPEVLEKIFEPFYTTKEPGKGTGLGMAMVMSIVKSCLGHIQVHSVPGKGSAFNIWLPALEANAWKQASPAKETLSTSNSPGSLMVVDDEAILVDVLVEGLKGYGFSVWGTTSPRKALEELKRNSMNYALLITDHLMPELTGIQLIREAKMIVPKLAAILCSGNLQKTPDWESENESVFLRKPVLIQELATTVKTIFDQGSDIR